jgi:hypothetical protein
VAVARLMSQGRRWTPEILAERMCMTVFSGVPVEDERQTSCNGSGAAVPSALRIAAPAN